MKDDAVNLAIAVISFTMFGAAEELAAHPFGIGFPFLMMAAVYFADRRTALHAILFAVAAGAGEDALSGLAPLTSATFFAIAAAFVRSSRRYFPSAHFAAVAAYPVYQIWLWMWYPAIGGGVFMRILAAFALSLPAYVAVTLALRALERKGAVDEP